MADVVRLLGAPADWQLPKGNSSDFRLRSDYSRIMELSEEEFSWAEAFAAQRAGAATRMAGYYNLNYRVEHSGQTYLVRIPIPDSDVMDLRRIDEAQVLEYIAHANFDAPRLLHISKAQGFAVHSWVPGETLNDLFPDDHPMPDWISNQLAGQMAMFHKIDPTPLAPACRDLATSPDTRGFFLAHYEFDCEVYRRLLPTMASLYRRLGIPDAPFRGLDKLADRIRPRQFVICHSDVHRNNILLRTEEQDLTIVDWELVLVGDPIYDIAAHFHKMRYRPDQESLFIHRYVAASDGRLDVVTVRREVDLYLKLERVKSAVIDAFRMHRVLRSSALSGGASVALAERYAKKLDRARAVWSHGSPVPASDPEKVLENLLA
jgi:aminoglycoside phosphotransferase (APT) family kinase protein